MKHTQGQWKAVRDCRSHLNRGVLTDGPMVYGIYTPEARIAVMQEFRESGFGPQDKEQEANARLMASAPKLLEALEFLIYTVEHELQPHGRMVDGIANARSEIAKAKGKRI